MNRVHSFAESQFIHVGKYSIYICLLHCFSSRRETFRFFHWPLPADCQTILSFLKWNFRCHLIALTPNSNGNEANKSVRSVQIDVHSLSLWRLWLPDFYDFRWEIISNERNDINQRITFSENWTINSFVQRFSYYFHVQNFDRLDVHASRFTCWPQAENLKLSQIEEKQLK